MGNVKGWENDPDTGGVRLFVGTIMACCVTGNAPLGIGWGAGGSYGVPSGGNLYSSSAIREKFPHSTSLAKIESKFSNMAALGMCLWVPWTALVMNFDVIVVVGSIIVTPDSASRSNTKVLRVGVSKCPTSAVTNPRKKRIILKNGHFEVFFEQCL